MKKLPLTIGCIVILLVSVIIVIYCFLPKTSINNESGKLYFVYNNINVHKDLSKEENDQIISILDNKILTNDSPSCGFTDDIAIKFGDSIFCIACDDCPIVKYKDKYFSISQEEREKLDKIFEKYGAYFPAL